MNTTSANPTSATGSDITVAAFDFDGTLTSHDSVVPFLRRFLWRPRVLLGTLQNAPAAVASLVLRDRDRLRLAATRALLADVAATRIYDEAAAFGAEIIAGRLRPDTTARLAWHRSQGHRVVLVSASYEAYLLPVAEHLGVDAVLSTGVEIDDRGRCSGKLAGANCRGPEKVRRLHEWLGSQGLQRGDVTLWAYGDSNGDRELLADADHPVWVPATMGSVAPTP